MKDVLVYTSYPKLVNFDNIIMLQRMIYSNNYSDVIISKILNLVPESDFILLYGTGSRGSKYCIKVFATLNQKIMLGSFQRNMSNYELTPQQTDVLNELFDPQKRDYLIKFRTKEQALLVQTIGIE